MKRIILASGSKAKKTTLEKLGILFEAIPSKYEEDMMLKMDPKELAMVLSRGKAEDLAMKYPEAIIIGADTFVVFNNMLMGKPHTKERAKEMLQNLSANTHNILTGFTVIEGNNIVSKVVDTKVTFKHLAEETVDSYVATGEPLDKAGAYAVQGEGRIFIEKIDGDHYNVVGLPLGALVEVLNNNFGLKINYIYEPLF